MYERESATFRDIDEERVNLLSEEPPHNCPVCALDEERSLEMEARVIESGNGVAWRGTNYHRHDFVMIKADRGPCLLGQISDIKQPKHRRDLPFLLVKPLGRTSALRCRPTHAAKDEVMLGVVSYHLSD